MEPKKTPRLARNSSNEGAPVYRVQVLDRAFAIIDLLAEQESGASLTSISRKLELNKTTVLRLLSVLEDHRYVERRDSEAAYRLGSKLFELGTKAVSRLDLLESARPYLRRLVSSTGETSHLAILRDDMVISLANCESPRTLRTPSTVGGRSPVHCTSVGKAIMAFRPDSEVEQVVRNRGLKKCTAKTITTRAIFRQELARVRGRGYAVDDEEFEEGLRCVAAPVWDYSGGVVAALSVTGPAIRVTEKRVPEIARIVMSAGEDLSVALGYRPGFERRARSISAAARHST